MKYILYVLHRIKLFPSLICLRATAVFRDGEYYIILLFHVCQYFNVVFFDFFSIFFEEWAGWFLHRGFAWWKSPKGFGMVWIADRCCRWWTVTWMVCAMRLYIMEEHEADPGKCGWQTGVAGGGRWLEWFVRCGFTWWKSTKWIRESADDRQVLQAVDGDLIWMTLITDAEGGRWTGWWALCFGLTGDVWFCGFPRVGVWL